VANKTITGELKKQIDGYLEKITAAEMKLVLKALTQEKKRRKRKKKK